MIAANPLDRLLDPVTEMPAEGARFLAELQIEPTLQARLDELAEKAGAGTLTTHERDEYAQYLEGLDVLGILQAKARTAMRKAAVDWQWKL